MTSFAELLNSIVLLLALGVIYDSLSIDNIRSQTWRNLAIGILVGFIGLAVMLTPWQFVPGIFFDARAVLLSLCGLYFGLYPTLIAMFMTVALRLFQGGDGEVVGCLVVLSSGLAGLGWRYWLQRFKRQQTWLSLLIFNYIIGLQTLAIMLLLPDDVRFKLISAMALVVLTIFPLGATLLGMLLARQQRQRDYANELSDNKKLLARERALLKSLIDSIPDLIFYKTANSQYLGCNKAFAEFIAKSEQQLINSTDFDLFEPDKARHFIEKDQEILATNKTTSNEEWVTYPDGQRVLLETIKTPFYDEDGTSFGLVGVSRNITERHKSLELLRQSELTYRSIISTAIDGFWIVALDGRIEDANEAYERMSGYSHQELCSLKVSDLDVNYDEQQIQALIEQLIQSAKTHLTSQHRRKDGSIYDIEVNIRYWPNEGGKLFVFIRDISERKTAQDRLLQSEARFRQVFESMPKIAVQGYNKDREVIFWNAASESLYGYSAAEARGKKVEDLIIPTANQAQVINDVDNWLNGQATSPAAEMVLKDINGKPVNVFSTHVIITGLNNEAEIYCIDIDLRAQKQAEERATILSKALEQSPMSVVITDTKGVIEYVNATFEQTSGYLADEVVGQPASIQKSDNTSPKLHQELWQQITSGQTWQGEFENKKKNGKLFWEQVHIAPITDSNNVTNHFLAVKHDISERKEQAQKILYQAHFDNLTGLPNRFLALDRLNYMLNDAKRQQQPLAVFFLDFDDFKKVNDTLGHQEGDELLVEAAARLQAAIRESDVVGRLGGDEFIVLVNQYPDPSALAVVAQKLLQQFRRPFILGGREFVSTISIGIATYPNDGTTSAELLKQADSAMYHSKENGRNTYTFFTAKMNQDVARRVLVEEQLRLALARNELFVCYQPLVNLTTQSIDGVEALLRWNNPTLGMVGPDEFIPVAEQTGLIIEIGQFVLQTAVATVAKWRAQFNPQLYICINVSPRQFRETGLVDEIYALLKQLKLPANAIELEITEGVLISGYASVEKTLQQLSQAGIGLAMDDFGTGYSSLSYLRNYPFNTLKIDKSFTDNITNNTEDFELVAAAISMGHALNLRVIAEGIEQPEQLAVLKQLNCEVGQGYYFGKPITAEQFESQHFNCLIHETTRHH